MKTAKIFPNLHEAFTRGRTTLIACPKLDSVDYTDKLAEIIAGNRIRSVTIVRMRGPAAADCSAPRNWRSKAAGSLFHGRS